MPDDDHGQHAGDRRRATNSTSAGTRQQQLQGGVPRHPQAAGVRHGVQCSSDPTAADSGPRPTSDPGPAAPDPTRRLARLDESRNAPTRGARHVTSSAPSRPRRPGAAARRALERHPSVARDRRLVRVRRDRRRARRPDPDQADHRRRLPARRVRPRRRDGGGRPLRRRPGRERPDHRPATAARPPPTEVAQAAAQLAGATSPASTASPRWPRRSGTPAAPPR